MFNCFNSSISTSASFLFLLTSSISLILASLPMILFSRIFPSSTFHFLRAHFNFLNLAAVLPLRPSIPDHSYSINFIHPSFLNQALTNLKGRGPQSTDSFTNITGI
ncbi:hypothetical protein V6Z11_A04G028000 [Gossypium hirsutum]